MRAGNCAGSQALNISRAGGAANFRNLDVSQVSRINNNVNLAFRNGSTVDLGRFNNGFGYGFANNGHWNNWAGGVRSAWHPLGYHNCFTPRFWATNHVHFPWARSYYWWGASALGLLVGLSGLGCAWPAGFCHPTAGTRRATTATARAATSFIKMRYVYINDQPIATAEEYAASAAELADVPRRRILNRRWSGCHWERLPCPKARMTRILLRVVQLAVDKDGTISGTMVNQEDESDLSDSGPRR